jgi:hypothetical protein
MALERVSYYTGQRLDADDFRDEQRYQDRVRRLLNHGLFTPGVVEGLEVSRIVPGAVPEPRMVRVSPGSALDAVGRLVVLDEPADVAVPNQPPLGGTNYYYLVLRYAEDPVPGRADECAAPGTSPVDRIRENNLLGWSEDIPFPRPADPEDSIEQGIVIALVELNLDCTIAGIDPAARRLSFPRNVSRVQAVAFEGEKDIAPGEGNSKKLYFHIRGGSPSAVVLYLRGDLFSPAAYTESATHSHTLSSVAVGPADVITQDHHHDMAKHAHQLVHGAGRDPGMAADGTHIHPLLVRARVAVGSLDFTALRPPRPQRAVMTSDLTDLLGNLVSAGYYERGWQGDQSENKPEFDETYMQPPAAHAHQADIELDGPTSTGPMAPAPMPAAHIHAFAATVDPVGSTGYAPRGGAAFTYPADVRVTLDHVDITTRLVGALPTTWTDLGGKLGGDENHPFNKEGTGPLDLVQLGLNLGPGEHLLEFAAADAPRGQPPVGGKIIYNLYIE